MSVVRRHIADGAVSKGKLDTTLFDGTYVFEKFNYPPQVTTAANSTTGAAQYANPTGATGDANIARFRASAAQLHVKGAGQTILTPIFDTTGLLDISQDQTDNEGVEYIFGAEGLTAGANPIGFTAGSSSRRFARLKFQIVDVSGTDDCAFGFRKVQASQANFDDYTDAAVLNVILGAVKTETILNNAATVTSASLGTWADGATHELRVEVDASRNAYFYYDGVLVQSGLFTFDTGDSLVPFFFFLQATTSPGKVYFSEFETGLLSAVDDRAADQF